MVLISSLNLSYFLLASGLGGATISIILAPFLTQYSTELTLVLRSEVPRG